MKKLVLVAAGKDQAGIVSALTEVLFELACNLEDTSMILLEDHFTVMMMFSPPNDQSVEAINTALQAKTHSYGLALSLFEIDVTEERKKRSGQAWMIGVTSPDQTGIIYHVSKALAQKNVNIYQLASRRLPNADGATLYLVSLEVDVPESTSEAEFESLLSGLAQEYGFDIQSHPLETFLL